MKNCKKEILDNLCYTDLVYGRINKKLNLKFSNNEIEKLILITISETDNTAFQNDWKKFLHHQY